MNKSVLRRLKQAFWQPRLDALNTKRLVSQHDMDTLKDGQKGRESQEHSKITSSQAQLAESFRVNQEEKRK